MAGQKESGTNDQEDMVSRFRLTQFDLILTGFVLHALGGMFFKTSNAICYGLCGLGLLLIFVNMFMLLRNRSPFQGGFMAFFILYLGWSAYVLVRPFLSSGTFNSNGYSLINSYTWLAYTTPLVVFLGLGTQSLRSVLRICYINCIIGILLLGLKYNAIFHVDREFDPDEYQDYVGVAMIPLQFLSAASFLVLCYLYVGARGRLVAFLSFALAFFTYLYTARRSNVFEYLLILLFTVVIYVGAKKRGSGLVRALGAFFLLGLAFGLFSYFSNSTFSFFLSRIEEDTRSVVHDYFYHSFHDKPADWTFGRGLNGSYYFPFVDGHSRDVVETGYLQLILKGVIVFLVLYVIALGYSANIGFFRTNNMLTKAMALYLFAHIIYLIPFGLPNFSLEYVIVWMCVFFCQSREWRGQSDAGIKAQLGLKSGSKQVTAI